jgi:HK97 gp10 family phage protein
MASHVEGADAFRRRLAALSAETKAEVRKALEVSASEMVATAKALAPVDEGDLRDSIRKEPGPHELAVTVVAGDERAFYARFVEFGRRGMPARPFFWPAYRALQKRIRSRINRSITTAAKKAATK